MRFWFERFCLYKGYLEIKMKREKDGKLSSSLKLCITFFRLICYDIGVAETPIFR